MIEILSATLLSPIFREIFSSIYVWVRGRTSKWLYAEMEKYAHLFELLHIKVKREPVYFGRSQYWNMGDVEHHYDPILNQQENRDQTGNFVDLSHSDRIIKTGRVTRAGLKFPQKRGPNTCRTIINFASSLTYPSLNYTVFGVE